MERVRIAAGAEAPSCPACGTASSEERCAHCGAASRAGPYVVREVIARSAHGAIYLAEDGAGARVALKELVFALVPGAQELDAFAREAALLRTLDHPRIPRFLQSFTRGAGVGTRLYLAQQYVPGRSLAQRLGTEQFDEAAALRIARQVLEVLAYLHGRSPVVVHRDVKPDNLIVGPDGALSLVDFGAARWVKREGTHGATLVGTFGYMAPEQLGGSVDARADLYGLGATLVHLLSRTPPERLLGPQLSLEFARHVNVSRRTERFLARLLAPRPQERCSSADEALALLDGHEEATAPPWLSPKVALSASLALALAAGALAFATASGPAPVRLLERVAPLPPPPPREAVQIDVAPPPPAGEVPFTWIQAKWSFDKPGHWLLDESGRGHHALLPARGFQPGFVGLVWDGTTGLTTADSADFAPGGPFTLQASFELTPGPLTQPAILASRGDPAGSFAWALELVPQGEQRVVRFSLADGAGRVSRLEGALPSTEGLRTVYATFDPRTGLQQLSSDCVTLGAVRTDVRPAPELPGGALVRLVDGVRGRVQALELDRGLMVATPGQQCSYHGEQLALD